MKKVSFQTDPALIESLTDALSEHPLLNTFFLTHDISYDTIAHCATIVLDSMRANKPL